MATGTVTANALHLRDAPDGLVLGRLAGGTQLTVLGSNKGWLEVVAGGAHGFVSARYVALDTAPPSPPADAVAAAVPPPAEPGDLAVRDGRVYGPGGLILGTLFKAGLFQDGTTPLGAFITANPARLSHVGPSRCRVLAAVCANEGRVEAVNTWDDIFLSFGALQWSTGPDGSPGELPYLLRRLELNAPGAYSRYFGGYGLEVIVAEEAAPDRLGTGLFALEGVRLADGESRQALRQHIWAYRFWRAGHDDAVRLCQVEQASARIDLVLTARLHDFGPAHDYVTSEYGVALLLDEHINRPGHVPATLAAALSDFIGRGASPDPGRWSDDDERALLSLYVERRAQTDMTDSAQRADRIGAAVRDGTLTDRRRSFVDAPFHEDGALGAPSL